MPHPGKASGACLQCKKSHIKCDEARPACGKCVKANKVCSGYAEGLDLVLRSSNESAKAQVIRRHQVLSKSKSKNSILDPRMVSDLLNPGVKPSLAESEESHAVAFFVSTFVLYPRDTQADRGFVELLPLICGNLRVGSPVSLALKASSRAIYSKWERGRKDAETLAFPDYGHAIEATRVALQDPAESMSDETLMAVCLLGFYEAATSAWRAKISPSRHFDGAAALIRQRRNGQMTELSNKLLVAVRNNVISRAMQFASPIDVSSDLLDDEEGVPQNPGTLLDLMCVEVANLLASANTSFPSHSQSPRPNSSPTGNQTPTSSTTTTTSDLLSLALAIDARLATWPHFIPSSWHPTPVSITSVPRSVTTNGFYGTTTCDIYPDIMVSSTWNEWRVARLMVLGFIMNTITSTPTKNNNNNEDPNLRQEIISTIQSLTDSICASIPFTLGSRTSLGNLYSSQIQYPTLLPPPSPTSSNANTTSTTPTATTAAAASHQKTAGAYGGWYMFAPLKETLKVAGWLREGQREWLRGQLWRLARMYGVTPEE